ncbi:MAG: hypothetical protein CSA33_07950 [Desulfobulbus propionicus]|nr:MAG: hypothetical protein CSA33_07950 [Desulfobulbus propionicus]
MYQKPAPSGTSFLIVLTAKRGGSHTLPRRLHLAPPELMRDSQETSNICSQSAKCPVSRSMPTESLFAGTYIHDGFKEKKIP